MHARERAYTHTHTHTVPCHDERTGTGAWDLGHTWRGSLAMASPTTKSPWEVCVCTYVHTYVCVPPLCVIWHEATSYAHTRHQWEEREVSPTIHTSFLASCRDVRVWLNTLPFGALHDANKGRGRARRGGFGGRERQPILWGTPLLPCVWICAHTVMPPSILRPSSSSSLPG